MPQLFDIKKVTVGPRNLEAVVELASSAPLVTSEDSAATERVLELMPGLADHVCLGDSAPSFGDVMADTELAHLLEHVSVELLAKTDIAGDVSSGQTVEVGERLYQITLACPDDVLVAGALSSAAWILQWAYSGGGDPRPDVDAIASGLVDLVRSLDAPTGDAAEVSGGRDAAADEPAGDDAAGEPEEPVSPAEEDAKAEKDEWNMDDVPRPHLVR